MWQRSINQERGTKHQIRDRFDLTLECIRRHYLGEWSPLKTLALHSDFFSLFRDFRGYVDHFLLNDLVDDDTDKIRFYLPFDNFERDALPASVEEYERTCGDRWTSSVHATSASPDTPPSERLVISISGSAITGGARTRAPAAGLWGGLPRSMGALQ